MNIIIKRELTTDEFGNSYFTNKKYYHFDDYIFKQIKEYLFKNENKEVFGFGILNLKKNDKYNIYNTIQNGLNFNKNTKKYTNKQNILVVPSLFGIKYSTDKLFVKYRKDGDKIICDIYDMKNIKTTKIISQYFTLRRNPEGGGGYQEVPFYQEKGAYILTKTDDIVGTIYLENKNIDQLIKENITEIIFTRLGSKQKVIRYNNFTDIPYDFNNYNGNFPIIL